MPLVRISLRQRTSAEYHKALSDGVHRAMIEAIAIRDDRFKVITEYPPEALIYDPHYLGVHRSDHVVFVQITMSFGRKPQQKRNSSSVWPKSWRKRQACRRRISS
jgi:4-oxalocrotonate tautomerase